MYVATHLRPSVTCLSFLAPLDNRGDRGDRPFRGDRGDRGDRGERGRGRGRGYGRGRGGADRPDRHSTTGVTYVPIDSQHRL